MNAPRSRAAMDGFRLFAALLVVANHTSPLASCTAAGDFWLCRVLARVAVPFFLMTSGHFLARGDWTGTRRLMKKAAVLYGVCVLLYLPLNWYAGQLSWPDFLRRLVADGTFYHLWYFPALLLGLPIARWLSRLRSKTALAIGGVLYLIGLGGDSYYGLAVQLPGLEDFYGGIFQVFSYTRNGVFFAPLFLLLGALSCRWTPRHPAFGTAAALVLMTAEAFWLQNVGAPRHDSMYLSLPLVMLCLFSLLLTHNSGERRDLRAISTLVYLLHPWCIVLIRWSSQAIGLEALFVDNSLVHFLSVAALSLCAACFLCLVRPQAQRPTARAWREINLTALDHNVDALQRHLSPGQALMAVLKADAYGHGAVPIARRLQQKGIRAFAVACLSEGIQLRKRGVRGTILILGYTPPEDAPLLRRWRLTQTVVSLDHGRALAAQGHPIHVHLAIDTGMHRLGIPAADREAIREVFQLQNLMIDGVFSHLCVADSSGAADEAYTLRQLDAFYRAVAWIRSAGYTPGAVHIQASYGLWNLPAQPCQYARAGILLYGVSSGRNMADVAPDLFPVLSLRARVTCIQDLSPGETAGYGRLFRAERETRLAVISIGYGDGLPRELPQRGGQVLIRGQRCPMVGRMCMDQLLVDVTDLAEISPGDTVTLIGSDGQQMIAAEDLAEQCGTITNELLSRLGGRLPQVVVP